MKSHIPQSVLHDISRAGEELRKKLILSRPSPVQLSPERLAHYRDSATRGVRDWDNADVVELLAHIAYIEGLLE